MKSNSFTLFLIAIYSASVVESATLCCVLHKPILLLPLANITASPEVNRARRSSSRVCDVGASVIRHPHQSAIRPLPYRASLPQASFEFTDVRSRKKAGVEAVMVTSNLSTMRLIYAVWDECGQRPCLPFTTCTTTLHAMSVPQGLSGEHDCY